jgi:hypothetical protein
MKLEFSRQFEKLANMKFHGYTAVVAELFHADGLTGRQTDRHRRADVTKLIVDFRNFANAPKNSFPSFRTTQERKCLHNPPPPRSSVRFGNCTLNELSCFFWGGGETQTDRQTDRHVMWSVCRYFVRGLYTSFMHISGIVCTWFRSVSSDYNYCVC